MPFKCLLCNPREKQDDFVAQLVEQLTLNQWVESSNLSGVTNSYKDHLWNDRWMSVAKASCRLPVSRGCECTRKMRCHSNADVND